jgi:hypothetical protein
MIRSELLIEYASLINTAILTDQLLDFAHSLLYLWVGRDI